MLKLTPQTTLVGLLAAGTLALMSSPALANSAHGSSPHSFGTAGEGAGELALVAAQTEFPEVGGSGVAVNDETHDVYVADTNNNRIDEFEADGTFVRAWGWGVADGTSEELQTCSLTCFKGLPGSGPGELESPTFIAVDNDPTSPSHGDVYVAGAGQRSESPKNLVQKFTSGGVLVGGWGVDGELDGSSAPSGPFGQPAGLTADPSGDLWILVGGTPHTGNNHVYEFDQGGVFEQEWEPAKSGEFSPQGIALDASGNIYISQNAYTLQKYSAADAYLGGVTESALFARVITGFAVAPAAPDVYVDLGSSIEHFDSSCKPGPYRPCAPAETFGSSVLSDGAGVAVDTGSSSVYVADTTADRIEVFGASLEATTDAATDVLASTATVDGTVNPKGSAVTKCDVEYGETEEYGQSLPCEAPTAGEIGSGQAPVAVHAELKGLQGGTSYHYRLVVTDETGSVLYGEDRQLTTPPTPLVADAAAVNVSADSASLTATLNPLGIPVTSCMFEYGTSTAYATAVPCAQTDTQIGSGNAPVPVSASITGLTANTEYHWRLVAENANGSSVITRGSADHTFVYDTNGAALPDGRAYEMVTPPVKNGASVGKVVIGPVYDLAEDGDRVIAPSIQCFAEAQGCTGDRQQEGEPYEFTRTPAGWVTTPLAPPATKYSASSAWEVGADEGVALFSMPTEPEGEDDFYAREPSGSFLDIGPTSPPETTGISALGYIHATADLSHLIYETKSTWPFDGRKAETEGLYEYAGSGNTDPLLVAVNGERGSTELISACGASLGGDETPEALSADGSIVYFVAHECHAGGTGANAGVAVPAEELFARVAGESADAHTVAISQPKAPETIATTPADERCTTAECQRNITETADWRAAAFAGASADGSKVFFTSSQQLTDQASQDRGQNLYLYDFANPAGDNLIDVSAGDTSGLGPQVQGVVATSADGTHVYFVAKGVLAMPNAEGQSAPAGQDNLYVYERDSQYPEGHTAYIVTVPSTDLKGLINGSPEANVTPDGRFLVFTSQANLTADDTRSDGSAQVFRYDAETEQLIRISIGDQGYNDNGNAGTGNATIVRAVSGGVKAGFPRTDPTMSNDGAYVFFLSPIGLTPTALDDVVVGHVGGNAQYAQNVYEYHDGRVYLISDGRDLGTTPTPCNLGSAVCLLGTDATGSDVFFTTTDQLVPADTDTQTDIYDARICTAAEPCIAPATPPLPPCQGEACHGIPTPAPSPLAPGTDAFSGQGNVVAPPPPVVAVQQKPLTRAQKLSRALKTCRRIKRKAPRVSCERQARKRFAGPSKSKKVKTTNRKRRAK
jgi:hypothetical protein